MKNKGGIILLASLITVLSFYQLYFTFKARSLDKDVKSYVNNAVKQAKQSNPDITEVQLDSIRKVKEELVKDSLRQEGVAFDGSTYDDVQKRKLNLGLDLQGGMHITLVVSPEEAIIEKANNSHDKRFRKALKEANQARKRSDQKFTVLFYNAWLKQTDNKKGKLSEIFATRENKEHVDINSSDDEILDHLDDVLEESLNRAMIVLRSRIDRFGATQPVINAVPSSGRIEIELPGVNNKDRVKDQVTARALLAFNEVKFDQEAVDIYQNIVPELAKFERKRSGSQKTKKSSKPEDDIFASDEDKVQSPEDTSVKEIPDSSDVAEEDTGLFEGDDTAEAQSDSAELMNDMEVVQSLLTVSRGGFIADKNAWDRTQRYLNTPEVQALIPGRLEFVRGQVIVDDNGEETDYVSVYLIKKDPLLAGDVVQDASQSFDQSGKVAVSMSMTPEGAREWARITKTFAQKNERIAIKLDDIVYSAPAVNQEITGGQSIISGNFNVQEAKDLANILKAGKLPAPTEIERIVEVGPSLGKEAVSRGLFSLIAGLILVVIFMVMYYGKGGIIADLALLFNIFFILGILATPSIGATLTLPGIAGIVLTIGMSIDANVLIFERIREELALGRQIKLAIQNGYKKAFWSIFDANATTLLTAIVLYSMGTGLVKGFAITLIIGIGCSFFSAVYITRLIVALAVDKKENPKIAFDSAISRKLFQNLGGDFITKRKIAYIVSIVVIAAGVVIMSTKGLNMGVAFKGGHSYVVHFDGPVVAHEVEGALSMHFEGASVDAKTFDGNDQLQITTSYMIDSDHPKADSIVSSELMAGLNDYKDNNPEILQTIVVGPSIADDIKNTSINSVIVALIVIFIYIIIRFRRWQFGVGALAALFHDVFVVISAFAIATVLGIPFEIDEVFIAAILTIVGYSINDTVVVYDRIREMMRDHSGLPLDQLLNKALNSTLSRTLMTSVTTLLVVLVLLLFGGEALRGFSFALLVGIVAGTYSSIFIATPVLYEATKKAYAKEQKEKKKNI